MTQAVIAIPERKAILIPRRHSRGLLPIARLMPPTPMRMPKYATDFTCYSLCSNTAIATMVATAQHAMPKPVAVRLRRDSWRSHQQGS